MVSRKNGSKRIVLPDGIELAGMTLDRTGKIMALFTQSGKMFFLKKKDISEPTSLQIPVLVSPHANLSKKVDIILPLVLAKPKLHYIGGLMPKHNS